MNEDLSNLARHVKARRESRDWTQHDVWNNGGPSNSTLTAIEAGRSPAPTRSTLKKLDVGLEWVPGSARHVLQGGDPTPIEATGTPTLFSPETVGGASKDADTLLYRRPEGLSDAEWDTLRAETKDYIEWLIEKASRQR